MDSTITIIKPRSGLLKLDIKELWQYRELFFIFAWRDIKVRYKQTLLGVVWAILQPLVSTLIFTIFFGQLAKIPSGNLPYPLFVLIGLVFWGFFSNSLTAASNSLISNEHIIKKIYFPRIILPLSAIVTSLVDFAINLILLLAVSAFYHYFLSIQTIGIIILATILTAIAATGLSFFFAALNVKYRDVRYVLPYLFQTLMFLTPVIYSLEIVSSSNQYVMAINPMTSIIESVRQSIIGGGIINLNLLVVSLVSIVVSFVIGLYYFKKTEYQFADIA